MFKDNTFLLIFLTAALIFTLHKKLIKNIYENDYTMYIIGDPNTELEIISPDPGESTDCYKNPNDKSTKAWTNKNSSQYPVNHSAGITNDLTDTGKFFNNNNKIFGDITSPYTEKNIPDRCEIIDGEIYCKMNDRLQNIPVKLNGVPSIVKTIGDDGDIFTNVSDSKCSCGGSCDSCDGSVKNVNGEFLNVLSNGNENVNNGGDYFEGVGGYSSLSSQNMELKDVDNLNIHYSL
tara:strand:- start:3437 stop:4138 length:702 start_codon:yes stop_codon:yes gene_type:complete